MLYLMETNVPYIPHFHPMAIGPIIGLIFVFLYPKTKQNSKPLSELWKLKQQVQGKYPDDTKIMIASGQDIHYEVIVKTMDATRQHQEGVRSFMMFPDVSLSSGIT